MDTIGALNGTRFLHHFLHFFEHCSFPIANAFLLILLAQLKLLSAWSRKGKGRSTFLFEYNFGHGPASREIKSTHFEHSWYVLIISTSSAIHSAPCNYQLTRCEFLMHS